MKIMVIKLYNGNKTLSVKEYLDEIKPHLKDFINNLKKCETQKSQLTIAINFMYFKNIDEERVMYSKSDNIDIMIYDESDEVIKEGFESLLKRYQI